MMIPRYQTYWRASGLWAIPRIPYGARLVAGLACLWLGVPLTYGLLDAPWSVAAALGCVAAGIGLAIFKD